MPVISSYYEILGVSQTATDEEIRQAYIKQSLNFHPDRNSSPDAAARFQDIANAYFALSDKQRRQKYDESLLTTNGIFSNITVDPFATFGGVFNDLLVPEVPNPKYFWQPIGTVAGALLGFIVLNVPGAVVGSYCGDRLGKIRDAKGMSVYEAFTKLSVDKRRDILMQLAVKMFGSAVGL